MSRIPLFCLLLLSLWSCNKKTGENQGLDNRNKQPFDIMSTKKGTWWLYSAEDGAVFYRYPSGKDSFVAGLTYDYFYRIDTTSDNRDTIPEYFGKNAGKYISLIDLDGGQKDYITYVILKDNWHVGQTWNNYERRKIQGWNVDMYIESRVESVNETLTINGKTYDSVIHVFNDLKAKSVLMPAYVDCGNLEVWFKKGIGIIKDRGHINVIELVKKDYADQLLDYHIEP